MDTMLSFNNNALSNTFMTKEEMRVKAPYIFAKHPTNPRVSGRYTFADTETIIDDMAKLGWGVVDCKQQRANKKGGVRSFHMVAFQNPSIRITNGDEVEAYPRIILTNSHDGFNAFKFMVGLFRLVCSNGLVVATETFENVSIRHINYSEEELRKTVALAIQSVTEYLSVINDMRSITLSEEDKANLAVSALKIRKGMKEEQTLKVTDDDIKDILEPLRTEDEGDDLWSVFNVLQEKLIKGTFHTTNKKGKLRKARPIKGIAKDIEINKALFRTAMQYSAVAA